MSRALRPLEARLALAFDLGGEQRLGQVLRCHRSHLDIPDPNVDDTRNPVAGHLGILRVPGAGHKEAAPIVLTPDQRAAVDSAKGKAKVVEGPRPLTRDAVLGMSTI